MFQGQKNDGTSLECSNWPSSHSNSSCVSWAWNNLKVVAIEGMTNGWRTSKHFCNKALNYSQPLQLANLTIFHNWIEKKKKKIQKDAIMLRKQVEEISMRSASWF